MPRPSCEGTTTGVGPLTSSVASRPGFSVFSSCGDSASDTISGLSSGTSFGVAAASARNVRAFAMSAGSSVPCAPSPVTVMGADTAGRAMESTT